MYRPCHGDVHGRAWFRQERNGGIGTVSVTEVTAICRPRVRGLLTAELERGGETSVADMAIGFLVKATDADDDMLTYTLGGADMASFAIDPVLRPTG